MKNSQSIYLSIYLIFFVVFSSIAQSNKQFYWAGKNKIELTEDASKLILISKKKFNYTGNSSEIKKQNDEFKVSLEKADKAVRGFKEIKKTERIGRKELLIDLKDSVDNQKIKQLVEVSNPDFEVSTAYKYKDSCLLIPSSYILLLPKPRVNINEILQRFKNKVELVKPPYSRFYTLKADLKNYIKISNELHESGLVEWVQPDFFLATQSHNVPSDPLYSQQWNYKNSEPNGIRAEGAWDMTKGSSNLIVSVIDQGVANHEDLNDGNGNSRVLQGIRLNPDNINPSDWITGGQPISNAWHGQSSAGVVAASHNNLGGVGVAPEVKIYPVNFFSRTQSRDIYVRYEEFAEAINRSWNAGASVINMSMGLGSSSESPYSPVIEAAVDNAKSQGRGGKGTVLVASSGNSSLNVYSMLYPAKAPNLITVGGSTQNGRIHENSITGSTLDLVAPWGGVVTTDLMGNDGLSNDNYNLNFFGTSASAPQVSGLAALMLSVNSNLSAQEVENIMKNEASKLYDGGGNQYSQNEQGAGLIRACESVYEAMFQGLSISGQDIPSSGATITLNGLAGSAYDNTSWTIVENAFKIAGNTSGYNSYAYLVPASGASGTVKIRFTVNGCGNNKQKYIEKVLNITSNPGNSICQALSNKCYKIKPVLSGMPLEVAGGGTAGGENIWQNYANNCGNQVFRIEQSNESQYCKILPQYTGGRAWELQGVGGNSSTTIGAEVKNIDYNGNDSQKFYFTDAGGGAYHISTKAVINAFGGTGSNYHYLDVYGGNSNAYSKLNLWSRNGANNQRFIFEEVPCSTSCNGDGGSGGGGGGGSCGMSITSVGYNCFDNILESVGVSGDGGAELQYRADAGNWVDYTFHIQFLSAGTHTIYVRKKYETNCQASLSVTICGGGSGGGGGGGGNGCVTAGCLTIGTVGYNCSNGILETVVVSGGSGNYQYALDNCTIWKDYQFHFQQISNGNHTLYVRDQSNTNCGDVKAISIGCNNMRQRTTEESIILQEEIKLEMEVSPNPSTEEIEVKYYLDKGVQAEIALVDNLGRIYQKRELTGKGMIEKEIFSINKLNAGQYFINIKTATSSQAKAFVKE